MAYITKNIKSRDIANYFVYRANKDNTTITNKKIQKLVYYAQAWSLVLLNKKLFNEKIEAWVHGPAVLDLYSKYKKFGFSSIEESIDAGDVKFSKKITDLLDNVWSVYGKMDARYLEFLTHSEKPWQEARNGLNGFESSHNEISCKSMKAFYSELLASTKSNA